MVALLSHSGSRGTGAAICDHDSKIAFSQFPDVAGYLSECQQSLPIWSQTLSQNETTANRKALP
jgi:hypothetical protein